MKVGVNKTKFFLQSLRQFTPSCIFCGGLVSLTAGEFFVYHFGSKLSLCLCVYGWLADLDPAAAIPRVAAPA